MIRSGLGKLIDCFRIGYAGQLYSLLLLFSHFLCSLRLGISLKIFSPILIKSAMKKRILFMTMATLLCASLFTSCKKSSDSSAPYTCDACSKTPDAKAAYDASSKGIYKGIVVGSSGTLKFDISNDNSTITATMVIDGTTVNLTSAVTWTAGQAYVAPFTGTLNGQTVTINFSVQADGSGVAITSSDIPGHPNATFVISKETSANLVECFEGTYSTTLPETGTFDIMLSRTLGKWGGIARKDGSTDANDANGTISSDGTINDENGNKIGTLSGDRINGTFKDADNNTVTISGKRTL